MKLYHTFFKRGPCWLSVLTMALLGCFSAPAQVQSQAPPPPPAEAPPPPPTEAPPPLTKEELDKLLGPIALYPDALIAVILPAATVPSDVVLAARFLSTNSDPAQIDNQPWDESVRSLARYPEIVKWMDQNLEWTTQLGEAFLDQPADVMNSIQSLRAQARAAGTLVDTPQQRVVVEEESYIRVVPAEPDVIYVPEYDPEVVYVQPYTPYVEPVVSFGIGFAMGPWLNYDCDWPRRKVCVGDWNPRWRDDWRPGWRDDWRPEWRDERRGRDRHDGPHSVNVVNITRESARVWQPSRKIERQHSHRQRNYDRDWKNVRGKDRDHERGRRSSVVARPSRADFHGDRDDRDRKDWQRSDRRGSYRDRSDRVWQPGSSRPPTSRNRDRDDRERGDWQRSDRKDSNRDRSDSSGPAVSRNRDRDDRDREDWQRSDDRGSNRGRSDRVWQPGSSAPEVSRSRNRDERDREDWQRSDSRSSDRERSDRVRRSDSRRPEAWQNNQSERAERREGRRDRDDSPRASVRASRQGPASFDRPQVRRSDDSRNNRRREDGQSIRSHRPNYEVARSERSSNRERSRSESRRSVARSGGDSRPEARVNRGSSRVDRPQWQSSRRVESRRDNDSRQVRGGSPRRSSRENVANYSRPRKSQQPARVERSGGQPRRNAPSYSRQNRQQVASAPGKGRRGGNNGDKKGNRDKEERRR